MQQLPTNLSLVYFLCCRDRRRKRRDEWSATCGRHFQQEFRGGGRGVTSLPFFLLSNSCADFRISACKMPHALYSTFKLRSYNQLSNLLHRYVLKLSDYDLQQSDKKKKKGQSYLIL